MAFGDQQERLIILQHHDRAFEVELLKRACAIRLAPGDEAPAYTEFGYLEGGQLWKAGGGRGYAHAWYMTGPPITQTRGGKGSGGAGWRLLRDVDKPDDRLEAKDPAVPAWFKGTFPKGHTAQSSSTTEEYSQVEVLHPDNLGLFAPQGNELAEAGSTIYDLRPDGSPDPGRYVHLQQAMRVVDLGGGLCGFSGLAPALQAGKDDLRKRAGGLAVADGKTTGLGSGTAGGPFKVVPACQHTVAGKDGPVGPVHVPKELLFHGGVGDGPLHLEDVIDVGTRESEGYWTRVHAHYDPEFVHRSGCRGGFFGAYRWRFKLPFKVDDPGGGGGRQQGDDDGGGGGGGGGDPGGRQPRGGGEDQSTTGLVFNPYPPERIGVYAQEPKQVVSPYVQQVPGVTFAPGAQQFGAPHPYDDPNWESHAPQVAVLSPQAQGNELGVRQLGGTRGSGRPHGAGGVMLHGADVTPYGVLQGVASAYTTQLMFPTGYAAIGLGAVAGGVAGVTNGFLVEVDGSGDLLFQTLDSSGAVTATATLASGSTSFGSGTGDVSGPASSTATQVAVFSDNTGKAISAATVQIDGDDISQVQTIGVEPSTGAAISNYGIYVSNGGFMLPRSLQFVDTVAGTDLEVVAVDTSSPTANYLVAVNGTATGWTLVDPTTVVGDLGDLGDVTITSAAQYQYLGHDGSGWVDKDALDFVATGNGVATPAHTLTDEHTISTAGRAYTCPLWLEAPNNTSGTNTGGAAIGFTVQGTRCGYFGAYRTSSSSGNPVVLNGGGTMLAFWGRASSTQYYAIEAQGILALKDTATGATKYQPAGSGYGHVYCVDGQLAFTDASNVRHILTGSATVQQDLNNSDSVVTGPSSDGETFVYSTGDGGYVAANLYAPPTDQDLVLSGTGVVCVDTTGAFKVGGSGGPTWTAGSGSPESVVTAPVGSLFSRTDGGSGTTLYVKESGAGNTGWSPV